MTAMTKKNTREQVTEQLKTLVEDKQQRLSTLQQKLSDAYKRMDEATNDMAAATVDMDLEACEKAKDRKRKAASDIEIYNAFLNKLQSQAVITEEESDKVIDSLLEYERGLSADFEATTSAALYELSETLKAYQEEIRQTELLMNLWTREIHANYNTRGTSSYFDPETGTRTYRSPDPVPIRSKAFRGCELSTVIESFLRDQAARYIQD